MRAAISSLVIWSLVIQPAQAWNASGHKTIASIAFRQLSSQEQVKLAAALIPHPRFTEDFTEQMPAEIRAADNAVRNEWVFQQAAVWPDTVRSGPPEKTAFHRPEWHYINIPLFLSEIARTELKPKLALNDAMEPPFDASMASEKLNIVQAIRFARKSLADRQTSPSERALLLAWLMHDVGDIHQPLHTSALFSQRLFPEGDRGANLIKTVQGGNMHAIWDGFLGGNVDYRTTRNRAIEMASKGASFGRAAADSLDEGAWCRESHELAKATAYSEDVLAILRAMESAGDSVQNIDLSEDYLRTAGRAAERRLVEAGYRLGAVLKQIAEEQG